MSVNDSKRYFWLKLKSDFFDSRRMKKLRSLAGGDTYTIIYLKLQLHALKTDGILSFENLEEDVAAEFALEINEKPDDVRFTLAFLQKYKLIETDDNVNFFLPFVKENTGSETGGAVRKRERKKALLLEQEGKFGENRGNFPPEIEKEIEIEIDTYDDNDNHKLTNTNIDSRISTDNKRELVNTNNELNIKYKGAMDAYQQNIGLLTPMIGEELEDLINQHGELKVLEAIRITALKGVHNIRYVRGVCENYGTQKPEQRELTTVEKVRIEMQKLKEEEEKWK